MSQPGPYPFPPPPPGFPPPGFPPPGFAPPGFAPPSPPNYRPPAPPRARRSPAELIQRFALGAGTLCLLAAAGTFLTMTWNSLGRAGQNGIVLLVTVLAALGSIQVARRGLAMSAEAIAALTGGLLIFDAVALGYQTHSLGLGRSGYQLLATAVIVALCAGLNLAAQGTRSYPVLGALAFTILPWDAIRLLWSHSGARQEKLTLAIPALLLAGIVLSLLARLSIPGDERRLVARILAVGSVMYAVIGAATALGVAILGLGFVKAPQHASALTALTAALALYAAAFFDPAQARAHSFVRECGRIGYVGTIVAGAVTVPTWAYRADRLTPLVADAPIRLTALVLLAAVGALLIELLPGAQRRLRPVAALLAATGAQALAVTCIFSDAYWGRWYFVAQLGSVTAALLLTATLRPRWRDGAMLAGSLSALVTTLVAFPPSIYGYSALALAITAALISLAEYVLPTAAPQGQRVVACSAMTVALALGAGAGAGASALAGVLIVAAAACAAHSALRRSDWLAVAALSLFAAALLDIARTHEVHMVEAYTLPAALVLAAVGGLVWWRDRSASSWVTCGPALSVGLGGSVAATFLQPAQPLRVVLVLSAAIALTLIGLRLRLAALVIGASSASAVLALSQLGPYAMATPRWVSLGLAGLLLLSVGIFYEQVRVGARAAGRWYAELR